MKIAFVTTSLDPGKCGVGDYTRDLANECVRKGNACCLISLNEKAQFPDLPNDGATVRELRMSSSVPWNERLARARELLEDFKPEWVSLQFVCYGYNPRGILHGFKSRLAMLLAGFKIHLMMHELWIGEGVQSSAKERLLGSIQEFFVLRLIRTLKPALINTSNAAYMRVLNNLGLNATQLVLFGSVPVTGGNGSRWFLSDFRKSGLNIIEEERSKYWIFGMFGSLHPMWPPEPLFSYLEKAAKDSGKTIVVASVGRMGGGAELWNSMSARYANRIPFVEFGSREWPDISELFMFCDFGISATPYDIIGKSASTRAMLEHGLPVIVNRTDPFVKGTGNTDASAHPLIVKMGSDLPERLPLLRRGLPKAGLSDIAEKFLNAMQKT